MDVSVVITCWNGGKLLRENLPRVIEASYNPENRIKEIIIVDDASTDDSVEYVGKVKGQKSKVKIRLIENDKNYGYSKTCNTGVKEAKEELVAILNLDVIPSLNFLESALPHFDDEKVFAVSFNEGQYGPGKIEWKKGFLEIIPTEASPETSFSDWANGGSSVFRKNIWEKLEGMDEVYLPFYFEDVDLGIRARKSNFKCLWEPKARVVHQHEATINSKNFDIRYINSIKGRNHLILTWKNLRSFPKFFLHLFFLIKRCLLSPRYLIIVLKAVRQISLGN